MAAVSDKDVWAVGGVVQYQSAEIVMHWDGNSWSRTQTLAYQPEHVYYGVAKAPSGDIFAVGGAWDNKQDGPWYALATRLTRSPCVSPK